MRYNDSSFILLEESFFSENGVIEKPWEEPNEVVVYRRTSELHVPEDLNLEVPFSNFEKFCASFLDNDQSKTFTDAQHLLLKGTKNSLEVCQVSNPKVLLDLLDRAGLKSYTEPCRYMVRIPCGEYNLDIVKFLDLQDIYVNIFKCNKDAPDEGLENLKKYLDLKTPISKEWASIYLDSST